jgi:hypothetical protein
MPSLNAFGASYRTPGAPFPGYGSAQRYPCIAGPCFTKSNTMAANKLYATRFRVHTPKSFTAMSVYQNSAATTGNIRLGIYNDSTGLPGSLKQDVGAVAFPGSTGWRTVTTTIALNPGWYWAACVADAALITIGPDLGSNVTQQSVTLGEVLDSGLSTVIGGSPDWASSVIGIGALRATLAYGALPDPFGTLEAYDYNVPPLLFLAG